MFTGIVELMGKIESYGEGRLRVSTPWKGQDLKLGQSVSVDGCCLTLVSISGGAVEMDVSPETLARTTLGRRNPGDFVNLERGMKLGDSLDGHLVTGHIDGVGRIREIKTLDSKGSKEVWFDVIGPAARWLAEKGSVAVDGISLTVNAVEDRGFSVALIPHTLEITSLGQKKVGDEVNLEFDVIAKYVERLLSGRWSEHQAGKSV